MRQFPFPTSIDQPQSNNPIFKNHLFLLLPFSYPLPNNYFLTHNKNIVLMLNQICSTDLNRIHSKKSLLNYLIKNTEHQLLSLKDNIVKLSYSNKLMNMEEETTWRLPIRNKSHSTVSLSKPEVIIQEEHIPSNRFLAKSLKVVKKPRGDKSSPGPTPEFPVRSLSRREMPREVKTIKSFYSLKLIQDKLKGEPEPQKPAPKPLIPHRNTKSYSQLLNQIGTKRITKLQPIKNGIMLDKISKVAQLTKVKLSDGGEFQKIAYLQNLRFE